MSVGFTVIAERLCVRCELADNPLVSHARDGEMAAVMMGRLYYQSGPPGPRADGATDVLAVYRRAGQAGLERLEGDFSCVVWDGRACRLIGLRDPNGSYPLQWIQRGDVFAVGTDLGRLLRVLGRWDVDRDYLAEFLTAPGFGHFEPEDRCAYVGVTRVPGGGAVVYRPATGGLAQRRHWNWTATVEDPGSDRVERVAPLVADRLRAAVRERLVGSSAAHLSGGMDSTAIALLADKMVRDGERDVSLHTVSLVYERLPHLASERPYVEAGIGRLTAATPLRVVADDGLDYDAYFDVPATDEPFHGLWRAQADRAVNAAASAAGVATMLTGDGADLLFEAYPHHLADLLRRGRLCAAWAEAGRWSAAMNSSRWVVLRDFGYGNFGWYRRRGRRGNGLAGCPEIAIPPWIRSEFGREFRLSERLAFQARRSDAEAGDSLRSLTLAGLKCQTGSAFRWALATPLGIHLTHPFQDPRVVGLALGIQARIRPEPGRMKPVLSAAMADILPPEILARRAKGCFDELYYRGLARNLRRLEAMVREAPIDDLGIFDKHSLVGHLEEASLGGAGCRKLVGMELALDTIRWLSMQDEGRRKRPEPGVAVAWTAAGSPGL